MPAWLASWPIGPSGPNHRGSALEFGLPEPSLDARDGGGKTAAVGRRRDAESRSERVLLHLRSEKRELENSKGIIVAQGVAKAINRFVQERCEGLGALGIARPQRSSRRNHPGGEQRALEQDIRLRHTIQRSPHCGVEGGLVELGTDSSPICLRGPPVTHQVKEPGRRVPGAEVDADQHMRDACDGAIQLRPAVDPRRWRELGECRVAKGVERERDARRPHDYVVDVSEKARLNGASGLIRFDAAPESPEKRWSAPDDRTKPRDDVGGQRVARDILGARSREVDAGSKPTELFLPARHDDHSRASGEPVLEETPRLVACPGLDESTRGPKVG